MNLQAYIDLYQLLHKQVSSREENRAFGLACPEKKPVEQLLCWREKQLDRLGRPTPGEWVSGYLYVVSLVSALLALVLGIVSGVGLLSYNGHEPVNMVYFMAMVVFLPLLTMSLSLFAMSRANRARNTLVHLSPAFWMERMMRWLPDRAGEQFAQLRINPLLLNWLVMKRAQILALLFSLGLFLALLGMVSTKDIAFSWSSTLQVTPEAFHHFLSLLSAPWSSWLPSAVPSVALIEQSQYFRLGETLDKGMVAHAAMLGEWWKFLACATLFYAIVLRGFLWLLASLGLRRALRRSLLSLEGADQLLHDINTPLVTTAAPVQERPFVQHLDHYIRIEPKLASSYRSTLGWAMRDKEIAVLNDSMSVRTEKCLGIGGSNTLAGDQEIIRLSQGTVLLYVKSWEPPTMDLVDTLTELVKYAQKVTLFPVGLAADHYRATEKELDIWERKLQTLDHPKVWLCRSS